MNTSMLDPRKRWWLWWTYGAGVAMLSTIPGPTSPVLAAAAWVLLVAGWLARRRAVRDAGLFGGRLPRTVPAPAGAAWAAWGDAASFVTPGPLLLGRWPETQVPLYLGEEHLSGHVLVLGPSRTGKTSGVIAPNILLRDPARESIVVLDVKTGPRALWNVTAGRYGGRAHLFCPLFDGSVPYNPLDEIDTVGAAQRKAGLLIHNTTPRDLSGDARVYAAAASDLAALLFLHVQQARGTGGHTVGAVYRLLLDGPGAVRAALRTSGVAAVRERAGMFASRERRIQDAAVTGLLQRLAPWADPLVDEATSRHWDPTRVGREPTALYILLPEAEAERLQPLAAWLIADLLDGLIAQADRSAPGASGGTEAGPLCPVRFFLDEFRRFGYLAGLSDRLPTLRERGVTVLLGVQVLSQLIEVYGERVARTLVANTETKLVFRAGDLETARAVSAWVGETTVPSVSVTVRGRNRATTVRPHVRPLLPPEDASRIPDRGLVALVGASPPLALLQARYFDPPAMPVAPPPFPLRRRTGGIASPVVLRPSASPDAGPASAALWDSRRRRVPPPAPAGGVRATDRAVDPGGTGS